MCIQLCFRSTYCPPMSICPTDPVHMFLKSFSSRAISILYSLELCKQFSVFTGRMLVDNVFVFIETIFLIICEILLIYLDIPSWSWASLHCIFIKEVYLQSSSLSALFTFLQAMRSVFSSHDNSPPLSVKALWQIFFST